MNGQMEEGSTKKTIRLEWEDLSKLYCLEKKDTTKPSSLGVLVPCLSAAMRLSLL
jgi:hypothetical protein